MTQSVLKVLLVDDDVFLHRIQMGLLTKFGYQVDVVSSGAEAISLLQVADFDLVLMDVMMPNMNGYETTAKLRQEGFRIPIFALTGNDTSEDRLAARDCGMNGFLTKPIIQAELDQLVAKVFS